MLQKFGFLSIVLGRYVATEGTERSEIYALLTLTAGGRDEYFQYFLN